MLNGFEQDDDRSTPGPEPPEDWVQALFRLTGRRPAIPAEVAETVRAAVRARWRDELRRRARRRLAWAAAALATAATVASLALGLRPRAEPGRIGPTAAQVEVVDGVAWRRPTPGTPGESRAPLRPGDPVPIGAEIETGDAGRAAVRLASGHSLRLDAGTALRFGSDRALRLDRGAVYVDSRPLAGAAAEPIEVVTRYGSVRDVGTQFEVRMLEASVRVRVRTGLVTLGVAEAAHEVGAGHELEMDAEGRARGGEIEPFGQAWTWVAEATPRMRIEGRSLREFLDWMAYERGLRLELGSPEMRSAVAATVLSGSIDGMSLDQALESVLPTCGMRHRLEPGRLVVERLDPGRAPR